MFKFIKDAFEPVVKIPVSKWEKIKKNWYQMVEKLEKYEKIISLAERVVKLGAIEADLEAKKEIAKRDAEIEKLRKALERKDIVIAGIANDYLDLLKEKRKREEIDSKTFSKKLDTVEMYLNKEKEIELEEELKEIEESLKKPATLHEAREILKEFDIKEDKQLFDNFIKEHSFNIKA